MEQIYVTNPAKKKSQKMFRTTYILYVSSYKGKKNYYHEAIRNTLIYFTLDNVKIPEAKL
jgi:hypothetical protein